MFSLYDFNQNYLLVVLFDVDFDCLVLYLELVFLLFGDVFYDFGVKIWYVYFLMIVIILIYYLFENGGLFEIVGVGNEGVLGIFFFMGGGMIFSYVVVQIGGYGY